MKVLFSISILAFLASENLLAATTNTFTVKHSSGGYHFSQNLGKMTYKEALQACKNLNARLPSREEYNVIIKEVGGRAWMETLDRTYPPYYGCAVRLERGWATREDANKILNLFDDHPALDEHWFENSRMNFRSTSFTYWVQATEGPSCSSQNTFRFNRTEEYLKENSKFWGEDSTLETAYDTYYFTNPPNSITQHDVRCVR